MKEEFTLSKVEENGEIYYKYKSKGRYLLVDKDFYIVENGGFITRKSRNRVLNAIKEFINSTNTSNCFSYLEDFVEKENYDGFEVIEEYNTVRIAFTKGKEKSYIIISDSGNIQLQDFKIAIKNINLLIDSIKKFCKSEGINVEG